jgi:hypothetical protein
MINNLGTLIQIAFHVAGASSQGSSQSRPRDKLNRIAAECQERREYQKAKAAIWLTLN